jgi:hypothetical protein
MYSDSRFVLTCRCNGDSIEIMREIDTAIAPFAHRVETVVASSADSVFLVAHLDGNEAARRIAAPDMAERLQGRCRQRLVNGRFVYSPRGQRRNYTLNDIDLVVEPARNRQNRERIAMDIRIRSDAFNGSVRDDIEMVFRDNAYDVEGVNEWEEERAPNGVCVVRQRVNIVYRYPDFDSSESIFRIARVEGSLNALSNVTARVVRFNPEHSLVMGENVNSLNDNEASGAVGERFVHQIVENVMTAVGRDYDYVRKDADDKDDADALFVEALM